MIINFCEIPLANSGVGDQDTFELFARDFLQELGYEIISDPTRGADGGKDLIIRETRKGLSGQTTIDWLVSCKHYSHSGKSITPTIEQNINDRIIANSCAGFIGFYSTIASEGLVKNLKNIQFQIFDREKIEKQIIGIDTFENIFRRYFPDSFHKWKSSSFPYAPIKLFDYYIVNAHKYTLQIFKYAFKTNAAMFVALLKSGSVEEFLEFRNITIHKYDIESTYNSLDIKHKDDIKNMSYTEKNAFLRERLVDQALNIKNTAIFDLEGFAKREAGYGMYILMPAILIINDVEYQQLLLDYNLLKQIIEN
ncbi:restriction endonuclease [Flavobacterium chryseum]|uniref:restriction endonuclease n=1 Tax=Flavobacterium sp. P3160 TaxID=2512113 RepID=UPI00105D5005|nr:restriction endonuclease [Flavobacterium sp. P3160]TDO82825.1 restriction endonuclease [Flavobacterium sp. P3160]